MLGISPHLGPHHTFLMQRFHLPLVLQAADNSLTTSTDTQLALLDQRKSDSLLKSGISISLVNFQYSITSLFFFRSPVPSCCYPQKWPHSFSTVRSEIIPHVSRQTSRSSPQSHGVCFDKQRGLLAILVLSFILFC